MTTPSEMDLERAKEIADPAQYGWCDSEGDGLPELGMKQLHESIAAALQSEREAERLRVLESDEVLGLVEKMKALIRRQISHKQGIDGECRHCSEMWPCDFKQAEDYLAAFAKFKREEGAEK